VTPFDDYLKALDDNIKAGELCSMVLFCFIKNSSVMTCKEAQIFMKVQNHIEPPTTHFLVILLDNFFIWQKFNLPLSQWSQAATIVFQFR